jgi:hypothetical protein
VVTGEVQNFSIGVKRRDDPDAVCVCIYIAFYNCIIIIIIVL